MNTKQLAILINLIQSNPALGNALETQPKTATYQQHTPPKLKDTNSKRSKVHTSPIPMASLEEFMTQDYHDSSTTSIPEEEMEGCED
jgi:hypothetical protein